MSLLIILILSLLFSEIESFRSVLHFLTRNKLSTRLQSRTDRTTTVVFDLDGTLCYPFDGSNLFDMLFIRQRYPDCMIKSVVFKEGGILSHLMIPHFQCLLHFLLKHECNIVFFSSGAEERNVKLVESYLSDDTILGPERYRQLKSEGQFDVYSSQHLTENYTKPLRKILKANQSIDDIMLVDDSVWKAESDELPLIEVPKDGFSFNTMYYLLGLFMDYFKTSVNDRKPLRSYFTRLKLDGMIPENLLNFTVKGLKHVRRTVPEAVYHHEGEQKFGRVDMKDVVPSVRHIEKILSRDNTTIPDDGRTKLFKAHVEHYFVPYYRDKLSDAQKARLPQHMRRLMKP